MSVTPTPASPEPAILVLPGLNGSGPAHWQSVWERRHPDFVRVEQESWTHPRLGDWALNLEREVRAAAGTVVLVAHSLACALVAHWARAGSSGRVAAALLVAPADVDALGHLPVRGFAPMPRERLPFASWVVASEDDPCCAMDRARSLASAWGARLVEAGRCGHLNVDSGHGRWPEGEALLGEIRRAAGRVAILPGSLAHAAVPARQGEPAGRGASP